jgi:23S rRNA (cytosine1962-C5)-methyltransferase
LSDDRYRLIDFGDGRKLESLAGRLIDRPAAAAIGLRRHSPQRWRDVESCFVAESKTWQHQTPWPDSLLIDCGTFRMPVRPTPFGHIGLFPEQADNWRWLQQPVCCDPDQRTALHLFAYTGAATMALAAAGFAVAHVDAAKPNVQAAKAAAAINGFADRPIRYLVDDAAKFAAREVRRGRRYQTVILDPPAYGHGPGGKAWRLERDLWPLLEDCLQLAASDSFRMLITGHSPQVDADDVVRFLSDTELLPISQRACMRIDAGRSELMDEESRRLDAGFFVRVSTDQ